MDLPQDDFILLSLVNTKLRDIYGSLNGLCEEEGVSRESIEERLARIGYAYDEEANAFKF
ncbi:MAG: DUF4250 domain-containing protein [Clostridia bacterium]|nr:DUF4250 domain-containing protein [Clostridia bacterium]